MAIVTIPNKSQDILSWTRFRYWCFKALPTQKPMPPGIHIVFNFVFVLPMSVFVSVSMAASSQCLSKSVCDFSPCAVTATEKKPTILKEYTQFQEQRPNLTPPQQPWIPGRCSPWPWRPWRCRWRRRYSGPPPSPSRPARPPSPGPPTPLLVWWKNQQGWEVIELQQWRKLQ